MWTDPTKWVQDRLREGYTPKTLTEEMNRKGIKITISMICYVRDGQRGFSRKKALEIEKKWNRSS